VSSGKFAMAIVGIKVINTNNRSELTEPLTDVNCYPYPKIGLYGQGMPHGHWIKRLIDPNCMFYKFDIFVSPT
jgi:hypothetical protein